MTANTWTFPDRLNMAQQVLDHPSFQVALRDGSHHYSYGDLRLMSGKLAAWMAGQGIKTGDRIGVLRSQDAWCLAAHIAIWQIGAISVPLFKLFKEDAMRPRLEDSGAVLVVTDTEGTELLAGLLVDAIVPEAATLPAALGAIRETSPEDPAILIYTSGTTGKPKGALHGHRILSGHLPGVIMSHDGLGAAQDCIWTPADWAWIGGLFDVAMPALALGVPLVAARMRHFDPIACKALIEEQGIRNVFFPPTALRMLKAAGVRIDGVRSVASGGEPLGAEMLAWGKDALGVTINEFYGQTECNMVASSCGSQFPPKPGCIGKAVAGFDIAVINESGTAINEEGDIAIRKGAGSMMLNYWNNREATQAKFRGDWMLTGDRGIWDDDYLRFIGRDDDVINSSGYRIGPSEIEDCLLTHPSVTSAGVVGKPDQMRGQIVVAYVVLKDGYKAQEDDLKNWVKGRLSSYAQPREVVFVSDLPQTVTGKVIRKELRARAAGGQ